MIRIVKSNKSSFYSTCCPQCFSCINFIYISPVYCMKCGEELINYVELINNVLDRIDYYKTVEVTHV